MALEIKLPTKPKDALTVNPEKLFLYSHTKAGKTRAASQLPNNLIIDLENGSNFVGGTIYNVLQVAKDNDTTPLLVLKALSEELKRSEIKYDYITLDTCTALEEMAVGLATILYKKTPMGKSFQGKNVVVELPNGAGYNFLRMAFEELYTMFEGIANKALIILGHIKNSSVNKDGKELQVRDIGLVGKNKILLSADMDAIGILYRNPSNPNQLLVSFRTDELDVATGARPNHLRQQEFILTEYDPEQDKFSHNWDKIFLPQ